MMIDELSGLISSYVDEKKSRSLCKLSKDAGVPYSTLRRIVQKEVKNVSMETVLSVLRVFAGTATIVGFVERHFPGSGKIFKNFSANLTSNSLASKDLADLIQNYDCWYAISLAERSLGMGIEELEYAIGKTKAKKAVTALEDADLIEYKTGRIHLKDKEYNLACCSKATLEVVKHFCNAYDEAKRAEPGHFLSYLVSGWNDKGLELVRETLRDTAIKLAEAAKNKDYVGDKTCYYGVIAGTLDESRS